MTETQRLQIQSLDEIKKYFYSDFTEDFSLVPEGTELCILLRSLLNDYLSGIFFSTKNEIPLFLDTIKEALVNHECDISRVVEAIDKFENDLDRQPDLTLLYKVASLLLSEYSREFHPNSDSDRELSFIELRRHITNTFNDKYEKSMINPLLYMLTEYGYGHTIICTLKYISRYFATDGNKRHNVKDILKAIHYIVFELTRLKIVFNYS